MITPDNGRDLSSQSTYVWPLVLREREEQFDSGGCDVSGTIVLPSTTQSWEEIIDEIMIKYADAWKRLANL